MLKFLIRFFLVIITILIFLISYLSYIGIETDKFDSIIKKEANKINTNIKLDFKKTKIHINPKELNIAIRLLDPKILIKDNEIILSKLNLFLPLKYFFTSDFILQKAEVAFYKNDIKDLIKVTSLFLHKIVNKQLNKIFLTGSVEGEFSIPFDEDGKIGKNYSFEGKILESSINITKEIPIRNLTAEINHRKISNTDAFEVLIKKGTFYNIDLSNSKIDVKRKNGFIEVENSLFTKGKIDSKLAKMSLSFLKLNEEIKEVNGIVDLETKFNFNLNKNYKIKKTKHLTEGKIDNLEIKLKEKKLIKKILTNFNSQIILKDSKIRFENLKSKHNLLIDGLIKKEDYFDKIKITEIYDYDKKTFDIKGDIGLTNSRVNLSELNYIKKTGIKAKVIFDINFDINKYFNVNSLNFFTDDDIVSLSDVNLNKNLEIENFKKIKIKTFQNKIKNNDFYIEKANDIKIKGEIFDAEPLLKSLYKQNDKNTFSKDFKSKVQINFDKVITGSNDEVSSFTLIASINKRKYTKLNLKGKFSESEIIEMSIYQIDDAKRTLHVISDRARPFIKNFDFVKGFEGGKLEYESVISKKGSTSSLLLTDFKVSKVPALAKLLTLASLQGIADTLSGEGIRFEIFEMRLNSEGNVLNIEDALAMGPAVSILMNGYVDKGKLVSLRGTLVPATKLNSIIASIPVVGDILVGKKTGEGVVGVSFKIKGTPKNIKTTVNPIKTLTPRFIVRAVEKMKEKKKEKTK